MRAEGQVPHWTGDYRKATPLSAAFTMSTCKSHPFRTGRRAIYCGPVPNIRTEKNDCGKSTLLGGGRSRDVKENLHTEITPECLHAIDAKSKTHAEASDCFGSAMQHITFTTINSDNGKIDIGLHLLPLHYQIKISAFSNKAKITSLNFLSSTVTPGFTKALLVFKATCPYPSMSSRVL